MRGGSVLNGFRSVSSLLARHLEDTSARLLAVQLDRVLHFREQLRRFASSDVQTASAAAAKGKRGSGTDEFRSGPAIAKMFTIEGNTKGGSNKKRKSIEPAAVAPIKSSPPQSRQDCTDGELGRQASALRMDTDRSKSCAGSNSIGKATLSSESTKHTSPQPQSPSDLTLRKTVFAKLGSPPSSKLGTAMKEKISILRKCGIHWRAEEMKSIFNHLGEGWVSNTGITELETMLLQLERAYEVPMMDVGKMVSKNPDILKFDVDKLLDRMEFFFMTGLGFKRSEMSKLLSTNPEIVSYDYNHMSRMTQLLRNELGINKQFLRALIDKHPIILKADFHSEVFQSNVAFVTKAAVSKSILIKNHKVVPKLTHEDKCLVSKIFVADPRLMTMDDLPAVRKLFHDLGLQDWEVAKICVKYPQIFPDATTMHLNHKLAFLIERCERSIEEIFRYGWILYKPINEIYMRFGFVECLGLDQRQWGLKEILGTSSNGFCKRITFTPVDAFTTFAKSWQPPKDWTECNTLQSRVKPDGEALVSP